MKNTLIPSGVQLVIEVERNSCPKCKSTGVKKPSGLKHFQCPTCQTAFCSCCFQIDPQGTGTTLLCPGCGTKLAFP